VSKERKKKKTNSDKERQGKSFVHDECSQKLHESILP